MPVVVTGASGRIGRVLLPQLVQRGEVRAVVRDTAAAPVLRSLGAKVAVTELGDTAILATVMDGAHTVVHLAGGVDLPDDHAYEESNRETVEDVVGAGVDAGVARFLFLSSPGASPRSTNAYLRAKGLAEEAVASSGLDHLILRCTHVAGPGQRWLEHVRREATRPLAAAVVGSGRQRQAPVDVRDVVAALVAADDRVEPVSGMRSLAGPDTLTADEIVDLVAGRARRKLHIAPEAARRAARVLGRTVHPAWLELLAADSLGDAPDATVELGVDPTPFRDALREVAAG